MKGRDFVNNNFGVEDRYEVSRDAHPKMAKKLGEKVEVMDIYGVMRKGRIAIVRNNTCILEDEQAYKHVIHNNTFGVPMGSPSTPIVPNSRKDSHFDLYDCQLRGKEPIRPKKRRLI